MKSPADMKVIQIELTNGCPMRCANCTRFCGHHVKPFFMDFETFRRAVDSLKEFRGIVGIMGGEPTIHPDFRRFMQYYRENIGYDDFTTMLQFPSADFMRHVLANNWHVDYSNHRGLWTSVTPRYYEHFELIQDVFGYQLLNDHTHPSMHQTHMVTRKELGIADSEWFNLRDRCWVQNLWSASITPKGAFFCEIAAAMDATLGGPGGWPIEPGWWRRTPADFGDQLQWCELCSACLPMPSRDANDETDDVSPVWEAKLKEIDSPKLRKGLVNTFDPMAYRKDKHSLIQKPTPYMDDQESRMGKSRNRLVPQRVAYVALLSPATGMVAARAFLAAEASAGRLDAVASGDVGHGAIAAEFEVPFVTGPDALSQLRNSVGANDWVLLSYDRPAPAAFHSLVEQCVFNPGVAYSRQRPGERLQFFSLRASSLQHGGDLFNVSAAYPVHKRVDLSRDRVEDYRLSDLAMFLRRGYKRINWLKRKISGLPVTRGPLGEIQGNRIT